MLPYSVISILRMEISFVKHLIEYKEEILFLINFVIESIYKKYFKIIEN